VDRMAKKLIRVTCDEEIIPRNVDWNDGQAAAGSGQLQQTALPVPRLSRVPLRDSPAVHLLPINCWQPRLCRSGLRSPHKVTYTGYTPYTGPRRRRNVSSASSAK